MKILVIAAHPDDEVLGMGGTIKKLTKNGDDVSLCVVTEGASAQYKDKRMIQVRKNACLQAGKILGVKDFKFLEFPDMKLDTIPHLEINQKLEKIIKEIKPAIVYTTPSNDLNKDHQKVFESTLVASRSFSSSIKKILSYEILGISKTPFMANTYEDISKYFEFKIRAFKKYESEIEKFPHPRSNEALTILANLRGIESNLKKAEAFCLIRDIIH